MIRFKINDKEVKARKGWTILETAREYNIEIPTLCFHEAVAPSGACRLCMVELREGDWSKTVASCIYPAQEGLNVYTETDKISNIRRWIFEMLLSTCPASFEIADMAKKYGVTSTRFAIKDPTETCILCGLCVRICEEAVGLSAISIVDRGVRKKIGAPFMAPTDVCVACGCCVTVCPTSKMESIFDNVRKKSISTVY
ncbi:MAG: (2Fe-2S)-binding protein [Deltaproteobacteria bacterium]|nr:(2Fe-2S)-binding protein [Deltaproteobacteria bacterium]